MTEAEWVAAGDLEKMLRSLYGKTSDRKLRLFGCACCRRVWDLLTEACFRDAVAVAERFADDRASSKELAAAKRASGAALERSGTAGVTGPRCCAMGSAWSCTRNPETAAVYPLWVFNGFSQRQWETLLFRDIFGNPFRPLPTLPPAVLAWNDATVRRLAEGIYEERAIEWLPILADALVDAGCEQEELIGHCRSEGPHVRGCWAVDLIFGRS